MSVPYAPPRPPEAPQAAGTDGTPAGADGPTTAARLRRWRGPLAVGAVLLLGLLLVAVAVGGTSGGPLDPENAAPEGSRATAQVLEDLGVAVTRTTTTRKTTDAVAAAADGATVLLVPTSPLSPAQLDALDASGADLVLLTPEPDVLAALAPALQAADDVPTAEAVPAQCEAPDAVAAGPTTGGGALVEPVDDEDPAVQLCFGLPFGGAPYAAVDDGGRRVVVLGQPAVLSNDTLVDEGNAALALRTLGARGDLVWYLPDPLDPALAGAGGPAPLGELLPDGLVWGAGYLAVAGALALLLWRGRRLGRLVPEDLPVVVRAAETLEGRGRLYRSAQARGHVAATLRSASLGRLAHRLGLTPAAGTDEVVAAAAAAAGRPPAELSPLYRSPAPRDDSGLVRLADSLDALEKEVRSS